MSFRPTESTVSGVADLRRYFLGNTHHYGDLMEYEAFVPTLELLIHAKLELAELKPSETIYDLGCGDGRVLIYAAQNYSVRGVGIEIRADLVASARAAVGRQHLEELIDIRQEDYRTANVTEADVVLLYLNRGSLGQLSTKLEAELRPGARIVTHQFDLPGWLAERQVQLRLPSGVEESLFLYRRKEA